MLSIFYAAAIAARWHAGNARMRRVDVKPLWRAFDNAVVAMGGVREFQHQESLVTLAKHLASS